MKYIILVGDGMGDLPIPELGNKTVLAHARTPAMDRVANLGELHLLRTVPEGYPPGSDVANLSLLGYRPQSCYTGRAPLEAASIGVDLAAEEVAFRCNLVTLTHTADGRVIMDDYSAGHISSEEARELIEGVEKAAGTDMLRFYPGISYRHLLVHQGRVDGLVTVPPHDHTGKDVTAYWQRYLDIPHFKEALDKILPFLENHGINARRRRNKLNPANAIWLWGEGKAPNMDTIPAQFGVSGALISAVDLLKGLGVYAGLEVIDVPGATGYIDTNYEGKVAAALTALREKDLVFVHVEAPDETAHQGSLVNKILAIEDFDQKIVQPIFDAMEQSGHDFRLIVAMDHFTPISIQTHSSEPVPIAIYDSRQKKNGSNLAYDEEHATRAGSMIEDGHLFFKKVLEQD